jgi:AIPR protein
MFTSKSSGIHPRQIMTKQDILNTLETRVDYYENLYKISRGQAFMLWYAVEGLGMDQDSGFEAVSYDGGNDKGIDLFVVDDEFARVVIGQGKFNKSGRYAPRPGELLELVHTTDWLEDLEALRREGRADLADAAKRYLEAIGKGYSVEYVFVYTGTKNKDVEDSASQFTKKQIGETPARAARVLHLDQLQHIHEEYIDQSSRIETETVRVRPNQTFEQSGPYGKALVVTIPGDEIRRMYETHDVALFDRNVRLFLGSRTSVNIKIRETLADVTERKNFWAYNNGMTFVCDRYNFDETGNAVTLHNFSIVNGCQTAVSIGNASAAAGKDVSVLARIIAVVEEPIVDSIITYTNSQNPIRPWDISSQDKNQKRLKNELAEEPHPFFYELRRGERPTLSKEEKAKYTRDGKLQVIQHDVLAQYLAAMKDLPVVAYKDKALLFSDYRTKIFPTDLTVPEILLAWQAGQVAEEVVRSAIQEAIEREDQEEVRILKRGGKIFVLASVGVLLAERNGGTFLNRLTREIAGSKRTREKLQSYAEVALVWYVQALRDMVEAGGDISQILRSEESWPKIHNRILASWRVQSRSATWVEEALPGIGKR